MNGDLMLAVLSMHAYSDNTSLSQIGTASVFKSALDSSGFFANAYTYSGEIIISYRGTDIGQGLIVDILNGWPGGLGGLTSQAALAVSFAQDVASTPSVDPSTITFTGHSLGGGLAGLVAGLYGREALIFDNMAFRLALENVYQHAVDPLSPYQAYVTSTYYSEQTPWLPDTGQISGYRLDNQILSFQSEGATIGTDFSWGLGAPALHSQALLVLSLFAEQSTLLDESWKDLAPYMGQHLLALQDDGITRIAYSVISEGVRPNGDTAVRSMFNDAADAAHFVNSEGTASYYIDFAGNFAEVVVQFAHRQARLGVNQSEFGSESSGVFHSTTKGLYLSLDSTFGAWGNEEISGWQGLGEDISTHLKNENNITLAPEALEILQAVDFAFFSSGGAVDLALSVENPMVVAGQIANEQAASGFVFGTDEIDSITGGKGDDFLTGGIGNDVLKGGEGADVLIGGTDVDTLFGEEGRDILIGGDGKDTLIGGEGLDKLIGGDGADVLVAGRIDGLNGVATDFAAETLDGGTETDYIVVTPAKGGHVVVEGGDARDRLLLHMSVLDPALAPVGNSFPLFAFSGGVISATSSPDNAFPWEDINLDQDDAGHAFRFYYHRVFASGAEGDPDAVEKYTVFYKHFESSKKLEIMVLVPDEPESVATITINGFREGDYGIKLTGPVLVASMLFDDISETNDWVYFPASQAVIDAAEAAIASQAFTYSIANNAVVPVARMGSLLETSGPPLVSEDDVRIVMTGQAADDTLRGNNVGEAILGLEGNDVLRGEGGEDHLEGGGGNDRLIGGSDADYLDGGDGVDTADYRTSAAGVLVSLLDGTGFGGDAEGDTIVFIENLTGSQLSDNLTGDAGGNRLQGFGGDDALLGGDGNDRLLGGEGADTLDGGNGTDTADYATSVSAVAVNLALNSGIGGEAQGDNFVNVESLSGSGFDDALTGDAGNNRLTGGVGDDTLNGMGGIDYLVGSEGNDTLTGGAGADVFVFSAGFGNDTITDFWAGLGRTDRVQLIGADVSDFASVQALANDTVDGVLLAMNGGADSILFSGLQKSALVADDFIFT